MPLILGANSLTGGYEVDNSLRFNSGSSDYLNRTPASAGNRRTFTYSTWLKFSIASVNQTFISTGSSGTSRFQIYIGSTGRIGFIDYDAGGDFYNISWSTPGDYVFRDASAWYHFVMAVDTTQASASNRIKFYINGEDVTSNFTQNITPAQNTELNINNTTVHRIGQDNQGSTYWNGYMSEINFIDGQALDPTSFGEFDEDSGIWKPIAYTGTYGTNGFYLEFKDSSALGDDTSGNSNDFTVNNLTSIDQTTDTPTNNFSTMNPLLTNDISTFSEGNCKLTTGSGASTSGASIAMTQGKWFAEFTCTAKTSVNMLVGLIRADSFDGDNQGDEGGNIGYMYSDVGRIYHGGLYDSYGTTWSTGDIIGIAFDADTRNVQFYKNGVGQGTYTRIASENAAGFSWFMVVGEGQGAATATFECNFGNPVSTISSGNSDANGYGNFEYAVPSGYYALCTKNLAEYG